MLLLKVGLPLMPEVVLYQLFLLNYCPDYYYPQMAWSDLPLTKVIKKDRSGIMPCRETGLPQSNMEDGCLQVNYYKEQFNMDYGSC